MKNKFSFFAFLLLTFLTATTLSAQNKACFTDDAGIVWKFDDIMKTSDWTYYGVGTAENAYPNTRATIWLDFSEGPCEGTVEIHAVNVNPDGCNFYSDSFIYVGSAFLSRRSGSSDYSGYGTWTSYCFGSALFGGPWTASGPCNSSLKTPSTKQGIKPFEGKQKVTDITIKVSPNPGKDYARIEYKIGKPSAVNITVYDINGLAVKTMVNENKPAGTHVISWNMLNKNGSRVPPGIYKIAAVVNGKVLSSNLQVL